VYVDIQISNNLKRNISPSKRTEYIDNLIREERIKDYLKLHPGCSIIDVVKYAYDEHFASKRTVEKIIDILVEKDMVTKHKEKANSRNYNLYLKDNNPLVVIPEQLKELENLFRIFAEELVKIYSKSPNDWPSIKHPYKSDKKTMEFITSKLILYNAIQIPFVLIDIINKPIKYNQRIIWNRYNKKLYQSLLQIVFSKTESLYQIALNTRKKILKEPYNYHADSIEDEFISVENKYERFSIIEKICLIRHRCKSIGLLNEIETILNYIIDRNMNYFSRLISHILPDYKWPNLENPDKSKLVIIHNMFCPSQKNDKDSKWKCDMLDKNPIFWDF
jgi:hypothetical protein